jgi:epoxyqueuosine reductase
MLTVDAIKKHALELGFDLVGITDAEPLGAEHLCHFKAWIDAGHAGCMTYMQRNMEKRTQPNRLLKGAQSVIVVGLNYKPPAAAFGNPQAGCGEVAHYACYEDYHTFIKRRLFLLAEFIQAGSSTAPGFKVCVDSVPLAERALAVRAGLGYIGRNHMLTHPAWGQEILLGELLTTLPLPSDSPCTDACSQCRRCIAACPTGALRADGQFDASKCINYLTIEHRADIHPTLAAQVGARVYGCDECVTACPWQAQAPACQNEDFSYYPERRRLNLKECLNWDESMFQQQFGDSPVLRIGLAQLQRNARICLDNLSI